MPLAPAPHRVLYLDHTAALSGGEIGLLRLLTHTQVIQAHVILAEDGPLVDALQAVGATVEVCELDASIRQVRRDDLSAITATTHAVRGVLAYARTLARRIQAVKPAVVHTNSLKAGVYGGLAARMAGRPVVWGLHDRIAPDYLPARAVPPMRLLVKTLPSAVMTPSQSVLESIGPHFRPGIRRVVIPLPVPIPAVEFSVRNRVVTVLHLGRLAPWKGQDVFLRAFAQAFPVGPVRARLVGSAMFGEDDYARSLERLAADLGIADRVDFVGFSSAVGEELSGTDVLVNSSVLPETLGQTIIEALGAGVPVIAPAVGGPIEYLTDNHTALLHQPGDVTGLSAALRRLADDRALRELLSRRGPAVAERFSPEQINPRIEALYRAVTSRRPRLVGAERRGDPPLA